MSKYTICQTINLFSVNRFFFVSNWNAETSVHHMYWINEIVHPINCDILNVLLPNLLSTIDKFFFVCLLLLFCHPTCCHSHADRSTCADFFNITLVEIILHWPLSKDDVWAPWWPVSRMFGSDNGNDIHCLIVPWLRSTVIWRRSIGLFSPFHSGCMVLQVAC